MVDVVGKNTPSAERIRFYVDQLERIDQQKKELTESASAIRAAAKAEGFDVKNGINYVLKARKLKPHDLQNAEDARDIYMHAVGMAVEPPLFRTISNLVKDAAAEAQVLEALKAIAPANGDVIMRMEGKQVRIWRDKDGVAHVEDYTPPEMRPSHENAISPRAKAEVPECTADEAEAMGEQAAKDNEPVIKNPFPYGDERRPRWDTGWRRGAGNDGMGGNNP